MSLEILNLSLKNSPNSTLEFEDFEKNMSLEILHLSLENSPNSVFVLKWNSWEFSKCIFRKKSENFYLWFWVWRILQTQRIFTFDSEFGEFSKLSTWVWRILQTHFGLWKKTCFRDFVSFESEFGEISKLNPWVWRILQTQGLSLYISPNSDSKETKSRKHVFFSKTKMSLENSPNSRVEFGDFLQTQVQNLQTHFFRKKKEI